MAKTAKRAGRKSMTPAEKEAAKAALAGESKEAKFSRLASARVSKTLKAIGLIANLSGSGYAFTQEQVDKIGQALNKKVADTLARFVPKAASVEAEKFEI